MCRISVRTTLVFTPKVDILFFDTFFYCFFSKWGDMGPLGPGPWALALAPALALALALGGPGGPWGGLGGPGGPWGALGPGPGPGPSFPCGGLPQAVFTLVLKLHGKTASARSETM